jgi:hypothetical protein
VNKGVRDFVGASGRLFLDGWSISRLEKVARSEDRSGSSGFIIGLFVFTTVVGILRTGTSRAPPR